MLGRGLSESFCAPRKDGDDIMRPIGTPNGAVIRIRGPIADRSVDVDDEEEEDGARLLVLPAGLTIPSVSPLSALGILFLLFPVLTL